MTDQPAPAASGPEPSRSRSRPLYPRLLRLRHIRLSGWQRVALGDAPLALAVLLVLADLASAWTIVALPAAVAVVVKAHDLLAGQLQQDRAVGPAQADADEVRTG